MSRKNRDLDEQFEAFLKESFSSEDSINSARINKILEQPVKKQQKPWWDDDDDSSKKGVSTSKSFLKKKVPENSNVKATDNRKPDNRGGPKIKPRKDAKVRVKAETSISKDSLDDISEKSEEDHGDHGHHGNRFRVHLPDDSAESINTDDLLNPAESPGKLGMDTLDELADKEKFFRDLEKNADGTIDYGRLNQELSATANTLSPEAAMKTQATLAAIKDIEDNDEEEDNYYVPSTPSAQIMSERDQSEQKPSMLSKVSLMDSLESTMNTTTSPQIGKGTLREAQGMLEEEDEGDHSDHGTQFRPSHSGPETLKTATGFIGTNTSQEIEALHNALEKLGLSATIGNDSQLELSSQGDRGTEDLVKKLLNDGTGKQRNVAEIMKELEDLQTRADNKVHLSDERNKSPRGIERQFHVEDDADELRGFDLSPAHPYHPTEPNYPVDTDHSQRGDSSHRTGYDQEYSQRGDSSYRGGFDTSHTEDTEMYRPVIEVVNVGI